MMPKVPPITCRYHYQAICRDFYRSSPRGKIPDVGQTTRPGKVADRKVDMQVWGAAEFGCAFFCLKSSKSDKHLGIDATPDPTVDALKNRRCRYFKAFLSNSVSVRY